MKHFIGGVACGVVATVLVWFGMESLFDSIVGGKCKAQAAHLGSLATVLEQYRAAHGAYPRGMTIEELARALEPTYMPKTPQLGLDYFSDGERYALFSRLGIDGPADATCCFEVRDRHAVMWPELFGPEAPSLLVTTGSRTP